MSKGPPTHDEWNAMVLRANEGEPTREDTLMAIAECARLGNLALAYKQIVAEVFKEMSDMKQRLRALSAEVEHDVE